MTASTSSNAVTCRRYWVGVWGCAGGGGGGGGGGGSRSCSPSCFSHPPRQVLSPPLCSSSAVGGAAGVAEGRACNHGDRWRLAECCSRPCELVQRCPAMHVVRGWVAEKACAPSACCGRGARITSCTNEARAAPPSRHLSLASTHPRTHGLPLGGARAGGRSVPRDGRGPQTRWRRVLAPPVPQHSRAAPRQAAGAASAPPLAPPPHRRGPTQALAARE